MPAGFARRFQAAAPGLAARLQAAAEHNSGGGGDAGIGGVPPGVSWKDVSVLAHWYLLQRPTVKFDDSQPFDCPHWQAWRLPNTSGVLPFCIALNASCLLPVYACPTG
jgi:hypothetical protein